MIVMDKKNYRKVFAPPSATGGNYSEGQKDKEVSKAKIVVDISVDKVANEYC